MEKEDKRYEFEFSLTKRENEQMEKEKLGQTNIDDVSELDRSNDRAHTYKTGTIDRLMIEVGRNKNDLYQEVQGKGDERLKNENEMKMEIEIKSA